MDELLHKRIRSATVIRMSQWNTPRERARERAARIAERKARRAQRRLGDEQRRGENVDHMQTEAFWRSVWGV